ncbi:MAG: hypothetical protein DPW11_00525 [bacterium]|nr:ATP-binding protein [Candidatus Microgenomates bacterium CPR3]MCQ3944253.1 hypothetical protein [bacterium]RIK52080.1 MAG: hypothetical protein DCC61_00730 [Candidatus Microgenomates bacterium]
MKLIKRVIENDIEAYLKSDDDSILFIWGPRRSGKTTLIENLAKKLRVTKYNFDLVSDRDKFAPRAEVLERIVADNKVVLIDEIQNYPEATVMLKILHDEYKVKVIATGSSELRQKSGREFDSLAGRYREIYCLPLSVVEILDNEKPKQSERSTFDLKLSKFAQIWGNYPEIYTSRGKSENERTEKLQRILDAYVLKDVIDIYELKNQKLAKDILTKIALQIGSEVSVREIANSLGAYHTTVANYIEIFIKNYILIPLPSFKTNARRAVSENRKLYFYDLGVRNMLVKDFRDLELRPDRGGVFENFILVELEKLRRLYGLNLNYYFYREYGGREIDLVIEDYKKNYTTVEIKVNSGEINDIFPLKNTGMVINENNYLDRLIGLTK